MNNEQVFFIAFGMIASLFIGFHMGWSSAFRKVDKIMEDFEKNNK